jgi:hypothetical protein
MVGPHQAETAAPDHKAFARCFGASPLGTGDDPIDLARAEFVGYAHRGGFSDR